MNFQDVPMLESGIGVAAPTYRQLSRRKRDLPVLSRYFMLLLVGGLLIVALVAPPVGKALAIAAAVLGLLGWWDGLVRHVAKVVGIFIAAALAPLIAAFAGPIISQQVGMNLPVATAAAGSFGFVFTLVGVTLTARLITFAMRGVGLLSCANHIGGGMLGATEGALIVAGAVWALAAFEPAIERVAARTAQQPGLPSNAMFDRLKSLTTMARSDTVGEWLMAHNPLADLPVVRGALGFVDAACDPRAMQRLMRDERIRSLLDNLKMEGMLLEGGENLLSPNGTQRRDIEFLNSPQFEELARNGKLLEAIRGNWQDVIAALSEVAPSTDHDNPPLTALPVEPIIRVKRK